jgi:hypothetical protein
MRSRLSAPKSGRFARRRAGASPRIFSVLLIREFGGQATIGKNLGHVSHIADLSRHVFEIHPDKGDDHDTKIELICCCTCSDAIVARLWKRHPAEQPG